MNSFIIDNVVNELRMRNALEAPKQLTTGLVLVTASR